MDVTGCNGQWRQRGLGCRGTRANCFPIEDGVPYGISQIAAIVTVLYTGHRLLEKVSYCA